MALSTAERDVIEQLEQEARRTRKADAQLLAYYRGRQRVEQLGMAIPPTMRHFLVVVNWPRVVVDTIEARQQVRSLILPGQETADPKLRAIWDANNLTAHTTMFNRDRMIYGRAFMSVGTNASDVALPKVRVESPRSMAALVDVAEERMDGAARFFRARPADKLVSNLTLYLPEATVKCERDVRGRWDEVGDRDEHGFGRVPIVMHLNRRMSGEWDGESEMEDILSLTDSAARALTNLQFAQEAHGIPRVWMTGVTRGDFVDPKTGEPIPQWEAYYNAIHTLTNAGSKVGQLSAADLKNFDTSLTLYGKQAATVTGFPARYFGLTTTNPPSADAIRADESALVRRCESQNAELGMTIGWAGALAYEFATGEEVKGNRVRVDWFDPATPTVAQRTDSLVKLRSEGLISREGVWDELGWGEPRKAKERQYLAAEAENDPEMAAARSLINANGPQGQRTPAAASAGVE